MQSFADGTQLGSYTIVRLVGRGGMGEVYEAYQHGLERRIALKVIQPKNGRGQEELMIRFMQEARTLAQVNHPNVVTIYAIERIENTHFIAMEFVEGAMLSDLFKLFAFSADEALTIFFQLLKGLKALHARQILHRDIKPQNLMLRSDMQTKILDFGIAKRVDKTEQEQPVDESGKLVGTMAYLPPEVITGSPADVRSDLWSLGAIFYEALVGHTLIGQDRTRLIGISVDPDSDVVFPEESLSRIPPEMRAIISRLCHRDPELRYATADDVLEDLKLYSKSRAEALPPIFAKSLAHVVANIDKVKAGVDHSQLTDPHSKRRFTEALLLSQESVEASAFAITELTNTSLGADESYVVITQDSVPARREMRKKLARKSQRPGPVLAALGAVLLACTWFWFNPVEKPAAKVAQESIAPAQSQPAEAVAIHLLAPAPLETVWLDPSQVPTLSWTPLIQAGDYHLQISSEDSFQNPVVNEEVSGNSYRPARTLPEGSYFWRLAPVGNLPVIGPAQFSLGVQGPLKLLSPTSGSTLEISAREQTLDFQPRWKCKRFAQSYHLQISLEPQFKTPSEDRIVAECNGNSARLASGVYYWRVRMHEPQLTGHPWSSVGKITVLHQAPVIKAPVLAKSPATKPVLTVQSKVPAPRLLNAKQVFMLKFAATDESRRSPASVAKHPISLPVLKWEPVTGAQAYKVELSHSADFAKIIEQATVTGANHFEWKRVTPSLIYWRVSALGSMEGAPSTVGMLDVRLPTPKLEPNYSYVEGSLFTWDPVPHAERYVVQWSHDKKMENPEEIITRAPQAALALANGKVFIRIAVINRRGQKVSAFSRIAKILAADTH